MSSTNFSSEMPFYQLTDFQLIWENETGKQRVLDMMVNNGFKEFLTNSLFKKRTEFEHG